MRSLLVSLLLLSPPPVHASFAPGPDPPAGAGGTDSLFRSAMAALDDDRIESRQRARRLLEQAAQLEPGRVDLWLAHGTLCMQSGWLELGRASLERAERLAADHVEVQRGLGLAWKWSWLASGDRADLARAEGHLARAAALAPGRPDVAAELTPLALLAGHSRLAGRTAIAAYERHPASPDALLALGCAAYHLGDLHLAERTFERLLAVVGPDLRRRFEDVPGAEDPEAGTGPPDWDRLDPDLTTAENEAQLDYFARVAQALLVFRKGDRIRWDMRAELFVRYGPPAAIEHNPRDLNRDFYFTRHMVVRYAPDPLAYPYDVQVWHYPALGMSVTLWDRSLRQSFQLPETRSYDPDPRPSPAALARHPELVALAGGRVLLRGLPPGVRPLQARSELSRFARQDGARLVAWMEAAGGDADSLAGTWAVMDEEGRAVARASNRLQPPRCRPGSLRVGDLAADLPPGDYRVDVAVADAGRRRKVLHLKARVEEPRRRMSLSDVVLLCGGPPSADDETRLRIEPDFDRRAGERFLAVYFEIAGLSPGAGGISEFAYTYRLRPAAIRGRPSSRETAFEASRRETHAGALRRQFVSVPLHSVAPGEYLLEIEVRDLRTGELAMAESRFRRE